jgi:hypothetical protein
MDLIDAQMLQWRSQTPSGLTQSAACNGLIARMARSSTGTGMAGNCSVIDISGWLKARWRYQPQRNPAVIHFTPNDIGFPIVLSRFRVIAHLASTPFIFPAVYGQVR